MGRGWYFAWNWNAGPGIVNLKASLTLPHHALISFAS
jgi:hypothetical protein